MRYRLTASFSSGVITEPSGVNRLWRTYLGAAYQKKTPELIHREFVDGVQGRVQLRGNIIEVSIYGFEHETAAAAILTNLDAKLETSGVDPRIPWLGNRRLRFTFH